ncbi:MAG: sodium:calcium antiporter [Candidatus Woesearchaeota archaeon]
MILLNLCLFLAFLTVLIKSANYATKYSSKLARMFHLSEFIVSFFIVAVISAFPEGTIAVISAIRGVPEFGLGTLLGSNVADLALVFGIVALVSGKGITVKSEILKKDFFYLALLLFPVLLGMDGQFSRIEGILLVTAGLYFFFSLSIESKMFRKKFEGIKARHLFKNIGLLVLSLAALAISANYAIEFGVGFAKDIHLPPILIGLTIVSIGTCLPELFFSIKAVKNSHDELALGDILGTVIMDVTIILGITAIIKPFFFDPLIIYVTGIAMFIAGILTVLFITTGKTLSKKEGICLLLFYAFFIAIEVVLSRIV